MSDPATFRPQPFYCEENIWQLAQRHDLVPPPVDVLFIFGAAAAPGEFATPRFACWQSKAAGPRDAVLWDYHVVLAKWDPDFGVQVWDFDTRLPCPCPASLWITATFQDQALVSPRYHPRFRLVPGEFYVKELASDRSHMRDPAGGWRKPPPPWDPPGSGGMTLPRFWNGDAGGPGMVMGRGELEDAWNIT